MRFSVKAVMYAAKNEWPTGGKRVPGALTIKAPSVFEMKGDFQLSS